MSLLFENALDVFDPETARLLGSDVADTSRELSDPVPLSIIQHHAEHHDSLGAEAEFVRLPLHEPDSAELTGKYVLYQEHDLRGALFGTRDADGDIDWVDSDTPEQSGIARRLRFWHSDFVPSEMPEYHDSPIEAVEQPRTTVGEDTFLSQLRGFVESEREAERQKTREQATRSPPMERYRDGEDVIPAVELLGKHSGQHKFRVSPAPQVGFTFEDEAAARKGLIESAFGIHTENEVLVHQPDGADCDGFPVPATVKSTAGRDLWVAVEWERVDSRASVRRVFDRFEEKYAISHLLNPVPFERETNAIDSLAGTDLAAVLAGDQPITFEDDAKAASETADDRLNQDQHLAVDHALLSDSVFCIHGPPGTGKTRTLVEFVRRSVQAGRDVLVCADSNQAADNLLVGSSTVRNPDAGSLHAYGQAGAEEFTIRRANARRSNVDLVAETYRDSGVGNADVVVTTNSSAARIDRTFDVLVLDEATQATCASSCVPLAKAEKVVLAGDHQQLPPYSAAEGPDQSGAGLSLFEHMYADGGVFEGVGIRLETQYRMHRDIAYHPNRLFYHGSLRNGREVDILADRDPIVAHSLGGAEEQVGHSWRNPTEARVVRHLVGRFQDDGLDASDIGVITPYGAQVECIESALSDLPGGGAGVVDTIDAFQGSERTAIIISFVRSNEAGDVGFLGRAEDGYRRLNVAMTRAERHCALVGDWNTLTGHRLDDPPNECVETYEEIYETLDSMGRLKQPDPALLPPV